MAVKRCFIAAVLCVFLNITSLLPKILC